MLDSSVAELYGVETREINQAVKNNPDKFPEGYILTLNEDEKHEVIKKFDNPKVKFSPAMPSVFTEKGLYMLATILKSSKATQTTIAIVETFAKIRGLSRIINQLSSTKEENQQKLLTQKSGEIFTEILDDNFLEISGDETIIEVNLAIMKVKHTIKRDKRRK